MASKVKKKKLATRKGGGMKYIWHIHNDERIIARLSLIVSHERLCYVVDVFLTGVVPFTMPFPLFTDQLSERPCGRSSSLSAANSSQTNPQGAVSSTAPRLQRQSKAVVSIASNSPCLF